MKVKTLTEANTVATRQPAGTGHGNARKYISPFSSLFKGMYSSAPFEVPISLFCPFYFFASRCMKQPQ